MRKENRIAKENFKNIFKKNRYKKIKQPLSTEEIQSSKRKRIVKTPVYNQMLRHKVVMQRFNQSFIKKHR